MNRVAIICVLLAFGCSKSKSEKESTKPEPAKAEAPAPAGDSKQPDPGDEPAAPQLLAEGAKAPDFTVKDHEGNDVSLAALAGKPVVLYWYPKDETPG